MTRRVSQHEGLLVVDKPGGLTSHDVVARVRRLAGTRRVGHAGTLDPMATGVLLVGVERATRLLGHLALTDKEYAATVRLGQTTLTDDAEGEVLASADAAGVAPEAVEAAVAALRGPIEQVPSAVSAVHVDGVRAYARVRAGEQVDLPARPVVVSRFAVVSGLRVVGEGCVDVDVEVACSTGTYVRALARDVGAALGVGGHLTALRRTRVGPHDLTAAVPLDALLDGSVSVADALLPLADAVTAAFPRRDLDEAASHELGFGRPLAATGRPGPVGAFAPDGTVLALLEDGDGRGGVLARPLVVFAPA